jgi:hypothetical protein
MESSARHAHPQPRAVPPPAPSSASRAQEARELRRRALAAGDEGVSAEAQELLGRLAPALPGDASGDHEARRDRRRFAASLLAQHGIRVDPPLVDTETGALRLRATGDFAVQGALLLGALVTAVGYAAHWPYGLGFALATALAVWLLTRRGATVERLAPRAVPRGRTLGALVAAATLALALLFVVLPVRAQRVDDSRAASAAALVQSAQTALQAGDLDGAERLLGEAAAADPRTPTLEAVRSRVIAARVVEPLEQRDRP